ncbi:MAG TPA: 2-dehydro-3-deoxygalactonokinase [Alphaproteobacteria bacterium]|nr:2-dehydro-3-deoxygalactonokinase [Alphaproteobacteria bacterium]
MSAEKAPALLALDWGTTSLRAFLVTADGTAVGRLSAPRGILQLKDGDFAAAYEEIAGDWLARYPQLPAIACGMIGSRQGWREAPYAEAPAGLAELAKGLVSVAGRNGHRLAIVPGVVFRAAAAPPDVMRGEETQMLGALADADPAGPTVFVLPGTHSKWAIAEAGRIVWFATFMTGELYAVLKAESILGRLMTGEGEDTRSFRLGLARAADASPAAGALLHKLFSARSLALFDELPATGIASYLSGLLIGSEIDEALAAVSARLGLRPLCVTLIGEAALSRLYREALGARGIEGRLAEPDATARGLLAIAQAAGLLGW